MVRIFTYLFITICFLSCETRQSKLTSNIWVFKEYNNTVNAKETKDDKVNYFKIYKSAFAIKFLTDNRVIINLGEKENIHLNWKWMNNKEDILIYRESDYEEMSELEKPFYGEYFVPDISESRLRLIRMIIPFEEREEFILEKQLLNFQLKCPITSADMQQGK